MSTLNIEETVRQQWRRKRRKPLMIFLAIGGAIMVVVGLVALLHSMILFSKNYEKNLLNESIYDTFEPEMVDLSDISEEPKEVPIKEWAEMTKDEKYQQDISEAFPKETIDKIIPYIENDVIETQKVYESLKNDENVIFMKSELVSENYLDIPLSHELQDFTRLTCESYGVPYSLVLALMESESSFSSDIGNEKILGGSEGGARYYGYMQLSINNCEKAKTYALDAHTPEGNIEMAILLLDGYLETYENHYEWAIMAYKGGEAAADSWIESGYTLPTAEKVCERERYFRGLLE